MSKIVATFVVSSRARAILMVIVAGLKMVSLGVDASLRSQQQNNNNFPYHPSMTTKTPDNNDSQQYHLSQTQEHYMSDNNEEDKKLSRDLFNMASTSYNRFDTTKEIWNKKYSSDRKLQKVDESFKTTKASKSRKASQTPSKPPNNAPSKTPRMEGPSQAPTRVPSRTPVQDPVGAPSIAPVKAPSTSLTEAPTSSPSNNPSAGPTGSPTISPSTNPSGTFYPSMAPSENPSRAPLPLAGSGSAGAVVTARFVAPDEAKDLLPSHNSSFPTLTGFPTATNVHTIAETEAEEGSLLNDFDLGGGHDDGNQV